MSTQDTLDDLGIITPQMAKAQGTHNLTQPNPQASETMSNLTKADLPRLNLRDAMYDLTGYNWINKGTLHELNKRASINRKGKRGRDDIVEINRNQEEPKGLLDNMKDKIKNFFEA